MGARAEKRKPTVISLFTGCGGSSLGYKMAGFRELLAVDFDARKVETFKLNFPDVPIWQRNITEVTGAEIMSFCKIDRGDLDILDGSPPCQGFSISGKRKVSDERNDLFGENIRMIRELSPKVFVIENVKGMILGNMKGRFLEYMKLLKKEDYIVKCKLMNAMWYGVPQSRNRLIYMGVRNDLGTTPYFPIPNNGIITVDQVLRGCIPSEIIPANGGKAGKYYGKIKQGGDCAEILEREGLGRSYFNLKKLDGRKPSNTIIKTYYENAAGLMHPTEKRFMAISELKRLQSFPDDFTFCGDYKTQYAMIGDSVPPKMMEAIARTIKTEILDKMNSAMASE